MAPFPAGALPAAPQPPVFGRQRQRGRRMPRQPRPPGAHPAPGSPGSRADLTTMGKDSHTRRVPAAGALYAAATTRRSVDLPAMMTAKLGLLALVAVTATGQDTATRWDYWLGLIRFGGHLPKGEYDVDHDGDEGQADAAQVSPSRGVSWPLPCGRRPPRWATCPPHGPRYRMSEGEMLLPHIVNSIGLLFPGCHAAVVQCRSTAGFLGSSRAMVVGGRGALGSWCRHPECEQPPMRRVAAGVAPPSGGSR